MTRSRLLTLVVAAALAIVAVFVSRRVGTPQPEGEVGPRRGGRLVASFRTEPTNFNRLVEANPNQVARLTALLR